MPHRRAQFRAQNMDVRIEYSGDGLLPAVIEPVGRTLVPAMKAWTQNSTPWAHFTPVFAAMLWVDAFTYGSYYGDVGRDDCSDLLDLCEAAREVRLHGAA
jgi:hypothetical protein